MTASPSKAAPADDGRKRLIKRIHAEARSRGMDTDARRDLQRRATGKESCADMTAAELRRVIAEMGRSRDRLPDGPMTGKVRALWISAWHLGVVRDRTDAACASWLRRQTGLDAAAWAKPPAIARAVQALQSWLAREAGVDWRPHVVLGADNRTRQFTRPRARVLEAQWRILHKAGAVRIAGDAALGAYASQHARLGREDSHLALDDKQADALIRHFGEMIRAGKADDGRRASD